MMPLAADSGWRCRVSMAIAAAAFSVQVETSPGDSVHIKGGDPKKLTWNWRSVFQSPFAHRVVLVISGIRSGFSQSADALAS